LPGIFSARLLALNVAVTSSRSGFAAVGSGLSVVSFVRPVEAEAETVWAGVAFMAASSYVVLSPPTPKAPGMTLAFVEESGVQAPPGGGLLSGIAAFFNWLWSLFQPRSRYTLDEERRQHNEMRTNALNLLTRNDSTKPDYRSSNWNKTGLTTQQLLDHRKNLLTFLLREVNGILNTNIQTTSVGLLQAVVAARAGQTTADIAAKWNWPLGLGAVSV